MPNGLSMCLHVLLTNVPIEIFIEHILCAKSSASAAMGFSGQHWEAALNQAMVVQPRLPLMVVNTMGTLRQEF